MTNTRQPFLHSNVTLVPTSSVPSNGCFSLNFHCAENRNILSRMGTFLDIPRRGEVAPDYGTMVTREAHGRCITCTIIDHWITDSSSIECIGDAAFSLCRGLTRYKKCFL